MEDGNKCLEHQLLIRNGVLRDTIVNITGIYSYKQYEDNLIHKVVFDKNHNVLWTRQFVEQGRLNRSHHSTFESYCREKWGMARRTAYQMIDAAEVVSNLDVRNCAQMPASESQARPLTKLEPEVQRMAWEEAVEFLVQLT